MNRAYILGNVGVGLVEGQVGRAYILGNVDDAAPADPHLWAAFPNPARRGDEVVLIGTNLEAGAEMDDDGTWQALEVTDPLATVAATANAGTSLRQITPGGAVDPRHDEITVEVPDWARVPGHQVRTAL